MKTLAKSLCIISAALTLMTTGAYSSTNDTPPLSLSADYVHHLAKDANIPPEEVQEFATAIATIQHFYINKKTNQDLFNKALEGMVSSLDPHSAFLDKDELAALNSTVSGKFVGIGVEITTEKGALKVISPLADSPAEKAGVKPGDLIIKVDDTLVQDMTLSEAINHIKGKKNTTVMLTIIRKNTDAPLKIKVIRNDIKLVAVKSKLLQDHYGYVQITFFQGPVSQQLHKAIAALQKQSGNHLNGLILDLRNNPGGLLNESAKVADTFLDSKALQHYNDLIVYTKGRTRNADITYKGHPGDMIKGMPMVVLINGGSASASEIVAGALQDYQRAVIMGTRSFGKGSVQTVIPITKDSAIKLTTALYYTPAGKAIQARGIVPNVSVPELNVSKEDASKLIGIDEADYNNHLINKKDIAAYRKKDESLKERHKAELQQAQDDYQLYTALMTLKAMASVNSMPATKYLATH